MTDIHVWTAVSASLHGAKQNGTEIPIASLPVTSSEKENSTTNNLKNAEEWDWTAPNLT
jgi:hypothetical protein